MFRPVPRGGVSRGAFQVVTSAANRPSGLASTKKNEPVGPLRHSSNPAVIPAPTLIFTGGEAILGDFLTFFFATVLGGIFYSNEETSGSRCFWDEGVSPPVELEG